MSPICGIMVLALANLGTDPNDLVLKLGSPRYVQREEAAALLEKLGKDAFPALKAGRSARDPEIRNRATVILDRIESDLLVRATMVRLSLREETLPNAIGILEAASGLDVEILGDAQPVRTRRVSTALDGPVPFWSALEELASAGGLEISSGPNLGGLANANMPSPSVGVFAVPSGTTAASSSISGPFRLSLTQMTLHRELRFGVGAQAPTSPSRPTPARPVGRDNPSSEQFMLNLQLAAEPRMSVAMNGPLILLQATDDRGNSLIPVRVEGSVFQNNSSVNRFDFGASACLQVGIPLEYPDRPGRFITTLKGKIPIAVSARKEDPLVVGLADGKGKTLRSADSVLTLHDVRSETNSDSMLVELSIRGLVATSDASLQNEIALSSDSPQGQLELVDADGKLLTQWHQSSQTRGSDGVRITLRVLTAEGRPAQLRYYDLVRASADVPFLFRNIKMP